MAGEYYHGGWTQLMTSQAVSDNTYPYSSAVSNDLKLGTLVAVEVAYGAAEDRPVEVVALPEYDGTNYLSFNQYVGHPLGCVPAESSTTHRASFWVPGEIGDFKVGVGNYSGASVTVNVWISQPTIF